VPEAIGTALCRIDEIPDGAARGFTIGGDAAKVRIFAVRRGDSVYVYVNRCPHVGTPLDWAEGEFLDREGATSSVPPTARCSGSTTAAASRAPVRATGSSHSVRGARRRGLRTR